MRSGGVGGDQRVGARGPVGGSKWDEGSGIAASRNI